MRLRGREEHVSGWVGGIVEDAEPDLAQGEQMGRLRAGENFVHGSTSRLAVRGGARVALTLAEQAITDLVAIAPWSQTGALLIAHSATNEQHYAYGLAEDGALALPAGSPTETGSRASLSWGTEAPRAPQVVELFEKLFVCDTSPSGREALTRVGLSGGALDVDPVTADLDDDTVAAAMKPGALAVFQSVLFAAGWEDETNGEQGHILRHSTLGDSPDSPSAWAPDASAIIGSIGQPIRAMKPGRGSLLVAKQQELFRIYGEPEALPTWQFGIQQLDATLGFGAVNARALEHADNRWWGIGLDGPWLFDGSAPERLVSARRRSWARVGDLSAAFVAHHPRRNAILFGFPEPASLVSGQRASRLWLYDMGRGNWAPDHTYPVRVWQAAAIPQNGVAIPTSPTSVEWVTDPCAVEPTAITLRWAFANASAQTEVWLRPEGGVEAQVATTAAGVRGLRIPGLTPGTAYTVRLRHRLGEAVTEFTTGVPAATRLLAVRHKAIAVSVSSPRPFAATLQETLILPKAGQSVLLSPLDGNGSVAPAPQLFAELPSGQTTLAWLTPNFDTIAPYRFTIASEAPTLPVAARSAPTLTWAYSPFLGGGQPEGYGLLQRLDAEAWSETSLAVVLQSFRAGVYTLQYKAQVSGADWVTVGSYNPAVNGQTVEVTIGGLDHSRRYDVRVVASVDTIVRTFVSAVMYTAIAAPVGSLAVTGSPGVTLTVSPADGRTGMDLVLRNSTGDFDALYAAVSGSPTDYASGEGVCGLPDTYYAYTRNEAWPAGLRCSPPLVLPVASPCV